jgi:hypothetical protein
MCEVCSTFSAGNFIETRADGVAEAPDGVRCIFEGICHDLAEDGLEFGEDLFNGVEIRTICREVDKNRSAFFDGFTDTDDLVNTDVVHEHDVTSFQRRREDLLDIGLERLTIHRSFQDEGSGDTIMAQCRDESSGFPVAMQHLLDEPLAAWRSAIKASDVGRDTGFINEHEPLWIESRLPPLQRLTIGRDIWTILLGGVQTFF